MIKKQPLKRNTKDKLVGPTYAHELWVMKVALTMSLPSLLRLTDDQLRTRCAKAVGKERRT